MQENIVLLAHFILVDDFFVFSKAKLDLGIWVKYHIVLVSFVSGFEFDMFWLVDTWKNVICLIKWLYAGKKNNICSHLRFSLLNLISPFLLFFLNKNTSKNTTEIATADRN